MYTHHPFISHPVQVLCSVIPQHIGGTPWAGSAPVLYLSDFATPSIAAILILPLPVHSPDNASAGKYAASHDLLALTTWLQGNSEEEERKNNN